MTMCRKFSILNPMISNAKPMPEGGQEDHRFED
ncbi:hypothetical protein MEA186_26831 [Mesorhizobium amorphae CCNWGS0123]|uniref:Uncharacterized protein n=1 Tax=Mesorhizobium amorphae CCNWGS0123 TaxID=1082933 RepID=G6YHA1_9HYPH|nr:hypothetical protein MEA186_26831 [Mesorhizobium amorphae CCNWGS0123]